MQDLAFHKLFVRTMVLNLIIIKLNSLQKIGILSKKPQAHIGHQSNGMVERHIQTIKRMLKTVDQDGKDPNLALLEYGNTPIDRNLKSNQLMFKRNVRGIVLLLM